MKHWLYPIKITAIILFWEVLVLFIWDARWTMPIIEKSIMRILGQP